MNIPVLVVGLCLAVCVVLVPPYTVTFESTVSRVIVFGGVFGPDRPELDQITTWSFITNPPETGFAEAGEVNVDTPSGTISNVEINGGILAIEVFVVLALAVAASLLLRPRPEERSMLESYESA